MTSSSSAFMAYPSGRWSWGIRTTASAKKLGACWPSRSGSTMANMWSPFSLASAAPSGCSRTPRDAAQSCRQRLPRVDVICPGFVADCLETLEEIAIEGKNEFLSAGGKQFHYIALPE